MACQNRSCLCCSVVAQEATGYKLEVATVRRLEFENDTFAFGDKLIKKWYSGEQRVRGPRRMPQQGAGGASTERGAAPGHAPVAPHLPSSARQWRSRVF